MGLDHEALQDGCADHNVGLPTVLWKDATRLLAVSGASFCVLGGCGSGAALSSSTADRDASDDASVSSPEHTQDGGFASTRPDATGPDVTSPDAATSDAQVDDAYGPDAYDGTFGEAGGDGGDGNSGPSSTPILLPPTDSGIACLGDVSMTFADFSTYWVNQSTACGSVSAPSGDSVTLSLTGGCTTSVAASVALAPSWALCGDFDIAVAFDILNLSVPSGDWTSATLRAFDPGTTPENLFDISHNGMAVERYNNGGYTPSESYKSYTNDAAVSVYVGTTDTVGAFRIARSGMTVTAYYWEAGDAGSGNWVMINTVIFPAVPWTVRIDTAAFNDLAGQSVAFSDFASTTP